MLSSKNALVLAITAVLIVSAITLTDWRRYNKEDISRVQDRFDTYELSPWEDTKAYDKANALIGILPSMPWYVGGAYNVSKDEAAIGRLTIQLYQTDELAAGKTAVRTRPSSLTYAADLGNNTYLVADPQNRSAFNLVAYTHYEGAMLRFDSDLSREVTVAETRRLREQLVNAVDSLETSFITVGPTFYSYLGAGDAPSRFTGRTVSDNQYTPLENIPKTPSVE